jgi:hypothetical protein
VHRDAGRLVDGEQVVVFEHDRKLARRRRRLFAAVGNAHRWDAHLVAETEPGVGRSARLVDADLAGTDDAIEVRARHALQYLGQVVVEPLAGRAAIDYQGAHRNGRGLALGPQCRGLRRRGNR